MGKRSKRTQNKKKEKKRPKNPRGRENKKLFQSFDLLMKQQLSSFGLDFKETTGDGNCLFRAISDQVCGNEDLHEEYRQMAISYMCSNPEDFAPFIEDDEPFNTYTTRLRKPGIWGGNLELQALSQALEVNIKIHILGSAVWEILNWPDKKWIHLSYHEESHYNSVRLKGDLSDDPPKHIPEFLETVEGSEENKEKLFGFFAEYFVDTFQEGEAKQVTWALKKVYKDVPGFDAICQDYGKIVEEMEYYDEGKEIEKKGKEEKKNQSGERKKPARLPGNKEKCWCGSGKIYKKCCKSHDHLRETEKEEEQKVVTKMSSVQI